MIIATNISLHHGRFEIFHDLSLSITKGKFTALIGPNGAGKSSLLSLLAGARPPEKGCIYLDKKPLSHWRTKELAQRRAIMFQHTSLPFAFTAEEVVALGFAPSIPGDVIPFMSIAGISHLYGRHYQSLSGGECQRVQFARALAQLHMTKNSQSPLLFLDEPTASLDPGHQHLILSATRNWMTERNGTVVAVLHDLSLAARYADHVIVLNAGNLSWSGSAQAMPEKMLSNVFDLQFHRIGGISENSPPWYVSQPKTRELTDLIDNDNHCHLENQLNISSKHKEASGYARSRCRG